MALRSARTETGFIDGKKTIFLFSLLFLLLSGCAGEGGGSPSGEVPDPPDVNAGVNPVSGPIRVAPEEAVITAGSKQTFKAEMDGRSLPVTWRVEEGEAGGSIVADGTYTASTMPGTYHLIAASLEDPAQTASTSVTVITSPVVSVAIEPAKMTLEPQKTNLLNVVVSGAADTAVTWQIKEGDSGGTIRPDGTYQAPAATGTYHIIATSQADPTKKAEAVIDVVAGAQAGFRFAYVVNSKSHDVTMFTVDPATGALSKIGSIGAGKEPYAITVDPMGRFVYAGNFGSNNISTYLIDQKTGELTATGLVETGIGPYSVTVDPTGRFAYSANENSSTDVWVYQVDQVTGALTFVETVDAGTCSTSVTVDPLGRFAYVANLCSNDVSTYGIQSETGKLIPLGRVGAGNGPISVAVDPFGRFAYVAHYNSNDVWAYRIDPSTGVLAKIGTLPAGRQSFSVVVEPSGRFVYVASSASNDVSMYRIDQSTGGLTSLGTAPGPGTPRNIAVDPSGEFVYVANLNSNDVSAYRIEPSTGLLAPVGQYAAGTQTRAVKIAGKLPS